MERMNEIAAFLNRYDHFAVIGHIRPDGDACGCAIAVVTALQRLGKSAFAFLPGGIPENYACFECPVTVAGTRDEMPYEPDAVFIVDVSASDRMGEAGPVFEKCTARAGLDHHMTNTGIDGIMVIDSKAAACAELVMALYDELNMTPDKVTADWLYIALCTDSGRFGFSNTGSKTLEAAAACVRAGANVDLITTQLYRTRSAGHTRLLGEVLNVLEIDETGQLCRSYATDEMFARAGALREDNEGIVNYLVEIRGVEVACLGENQGDKSKLSLRSRGKVNVAEIARTMGGGGHACAAGVTTTLPLREAIDLAMKLAREALDKV